MAGVRPRNHEALLGVINASWPMAVPILHGTLRIDLPALSRAPNRRNPYFST